MTPHTPDPNGLPPAPTRGCPISAAMFDVLLAAARKGGWPAVYAVFAEGDTVAEPTPSGIHERPARRRTLAQFLDRRSDLKALLDSACQEKRDRLLSQLEDEVEKIALGPGDVTTDLRADGTVARTRVDRRNKLYAALRLLQAHDPQTYAERRKLDVDGQIDHRHAHAHLSVGVPSGYAVDADAMMALEPADRAELMRLLTLVEEARLERQRPAMPAGDQA